MVFLFCATAFGVVLTLGGLRYSTVETEIYLLTTQLLDLQAAAALSILQLRRGHALLLYVAQPAAGRRRARRSTARRARPSPGPARGDLPALVATAVAAGPRRPRRSLTLVVGSLQRRRRLGPGATTGALGPPAASSALLVPVTDALANSCARAVDATWMRCCSGCLVAVVVTRRSRSRAERRVRAVLDGALHAAARGLRGDPRLRLPDHPRPAAARPARLAAAGADRPGAGGAAARGAHRSRRCSPSIDDRQRQAAASLGASPLRALRHRRPAGGVAAAARRHRLRVRGVAGRVRRDQLPGPRRPARRCRW